MTIPLRVVALSLVVGFALASAARAQTPDPQTVPPVPPAAPSPEPANNFPNFNIYLPEGEFDIRLRRLIKNVLFEGQVNYEFADGDVSTFLRYKYYARTFTYKLGVFDTIEFAGVEEARLDFDRVRGGLFLFELPMDYNHRWFGLAQVDSLSFGDTTRPDNNKTNVYGKIGYQLGTPFDERLNSIVGETRGRIAQVLTAYREIGPQKMGVALALTHSLSSLGDFDYLKFEGEGLKRSDFGNVSFLISRLHLGSFLMRQELDLEPPRPPIEQFSIPRYEIFRLGGRDAMKGIDDRLARGTDEIHYTNEFFFPVFRNRDYGALGAVFTNMFAIGYMGVGTIGFDHDALVQLDDYALDAGLGFEASAFVRDVEVFITAVYAQTLISPDEWEGHEYRVSVRTSR